MSTLSEDYANIKDLVVTEVPAGSTAVLNCHSNDFNHNFMFWLFNKNQVIGPMNNNFDKSKYNYEVLSGTLRVSRVSPQESGFYKCISKTVDGLGISVAEVEMIVKESTFSAIDAIKIISIVISMIVIIGCTILYYRLRKDWKKYYNRTIIPVEEFEDDDVEVVYNRTTSVMKPGPSRNQSSDQLLYGKPVPGPSRNQSSDQLLYGVDNQGLDTDFNSVFENIQIKSQNKSLI